MAMTLRRSALMALRLALLALDLTLSVAVMVAAGAMVVAFCVAGIVVPVLLIFALLSIG
jgi:hypothetical protein